MPVPALHPHARLLRRQDGSMGGSSAVFVSLAVVIISILGLLVLASWIRSRRIRSTTPPWFVPRFLHTRWVKWTPNKYSNLNTGPELQPASSSLATRSSLELPTNSANEGELDRRQSVRSILTLPPYHVAPLPSERLIAREGERAGVDVVIEYPETETEAEARREEEMDALYQIRATRRREEAEREQRRDERRRARDAGDWQLLEQLEQDSRERARRRAADEQTLVSAINNAEQTSDPHLAAPSSRQLVAELHSLREANARSRRVSSVSYAELGLARHDGSRLRADSVDSRDDRPLLDSAASMGGGQRSRAVSQAGSDQASRDGSRAPSASGPSGRHARQYSEGQASLRSGDSEGHVRRPSQPRLLTPQPSGGSYLPPHPPSYEDDLSVHGGDAPPYENSGQVRREETASATQKGDSGSGGGRASGSGSNDGIVEWSSSSPAATPNSSDPEQSHQHSPDADMDPELSASMHAASSYLSHDPSNCEYDDEEVQGGPPVRMQPRLSTAPLSAVNDKGKNPAELPAKQIPALSRLQTNDTPPAVEVTSATPVGSLASTPWDAGMDLRRD